MRVDAMRNTLVTMALACAGWAAHGQQTSKDALQPGQHSVSEQQVEQWINTLNNWGRWGKDDELGTLNLITPAKRRQAAALVKAGISVSMAHRLMTAKDPLSRTAQRPFVIRMSHSTSFGDTLEINSHQGAVTHMDTPCHMYHNGKHYNGWPTKDVVSMEDGCLKFGVDNLKDGYITRGILIDLPRLRGVPFLEPGTRLYREDVEAFEKKTGIRIGTGDAVFVRTGRWTRRAMGLIDDPPIGVTLRSGFDASFIPFIKERDIALLGGDENMLEHQGPYTKTVSDLMTWVIHKYTLIALGMYVVDSADFDAVAETAAKLNRWEFFVSVAPVRITGGTGSLINPIAVF